MADAKTKEQRDKEWWDAWWEEDFSWDGLAKKSWDGWLVLPDGSFAEEQTGDTPPPDGARAATLQDYWRDQERDLITGPDGIRFTRVHLPPAWRDGTPTGKTEWGDWALDASLAPKLLAGGETVFTGQWGFRELEGPDRRAQLQGCVLLRAATHPQDNASPLSARFERAAFLRDASFDSATFSGDASFLSATFSGDAYFGSAKFQGRTSFFGASFDTLVSFRLKDWPSAAQDWHGAFNQAVFKAAPIFTGAGFKALAAFDGAVLERGLIFDDKPAKVSDKIFQSERRDAIKAAKTDLAAWVEEQEREQKGEPSEVEGEGAAEKKKPKRISGRERKKELEKFRNRRLAELEGGCRTLKRAMEYASNKTREQLFYRYELIARRAQTSTPLSEKIFSYLYDWLGNYGASIGRPFMAVTALTLLFSGIYWGLDIGWWAAVSHAGAVNSAATFDPDLARAMSFSASRIFPFGAFDDVSREWLQSYEAVHGALAGLWLRILASLQSAIALTLVFMVGLAVRRKFQIN
jgi:hypothetical protein